MNPYIINFKKIGKSSEGYLSISESNKDIPFGIKRTFWTYYTPEEVIRGRHTHYNTEMVLIAVNGTIVVNTESISGDKNSFVLDKPNVGLFLPKFSWHTMQFSHSSVLLVIASSPYNEKDYIREYEDFELIKSIQTEQNSGNIYSFYHKQLKLVEAQFEIKNKGVILDIQLTENVNPKFIRIIFNLLIAIAIDNQWKTVILDSSKYLYLQKHLDYVFEKIDENWMSLDVKNRI